MDLPIGPAALHNGTVLHPQPLFNMYPPFYPHPFMFSFMPQNDLGGHDVFQVMQLQAQAPRTL